MQNLDRARSWSTNRKSRGPRAHFLARLRPSAERRRPWAVTALLTLVLAVLVAPASPAAAAPGDAAQLYLGPSFEAPVVGSDKDLTAPTECPSNSVLTGVQTENRQNIPPEGANAILTRFALQCSTITVNGAGVVTGTVNPTWINGPVYDESRGNVQTGTCPADTFVHRITGTTFVGDAGGDRWPSSVQITCRPMILTPTGQIRIDLAATPTVLTIGENLNTNGGLDTPTPRCGPGDTTGTSDIIVRGYRAQSGGEGIDGFNPSCTTVPDDFGDAPASYGSASHELNAAAYLGWSEDAETAMQHSADASGDNQVVGTAPNQAIDDENGVSAFGPITAGITESYSVSVLVANKTPGTTATLVGWVDFDRNGVFDTTEGVSVTVPAGTPDGSSVTLTWPDIISQTVAGPTFARFRIANGSDLTTATPTGAAITGEVEDYELTIAAANPTLSLVKTATPTGPEAFAAGQVIDYSFLVTNTGDVTLTDVAIDETAFNGSGTMSAVVCPTSTLAVGDSTTCTASYTLTQADIDRGSLSNTATATGTPPGILAPPVSPPSSVTVPAAAAPSIALVKSADVDEITAAGQPITYSFLVTNTGNVTLTDVDVTETAFTGTGTAPIVTCPAGAASLGPGATVTCEATYTTTAADYLATSLDNTATATGTPPSGQPAVSPPSTVEIPVQPAPALTVVKSASPNAADDYVVGQEITYSFVVTNTGNVTLTDVTVDETAFTGTGTLSPVACPVGAASLAPGLQVVCTATYVLTQADVDNGSVSNTATATGTPPSGEPPVSPPSTTEVPVDPAPGLSIVKSATPETMTDVGQTLTYSFVITNTGNVTLTDVDVDETEFSGEGQLSPIDCPPAASSVLPGQIVTCTADYRTTQADVDSGLLTNTATATGTPPSGAPPVSPPSTVEVPFDGDNSLGIEKRANAVDVNGNGVIDPGDRIEWTIAVTNTGAQTISDIVVDDPTAGPVACPATSLASGEEMICTVPPHTVTAADVRSGEVRNVATVTGTPPGGDPLDPPSSETTTRVFPPPPPTLAVTGGAVSAGLLLGGLLLVAGSALLPGTRRRRLVRG